MSSGSFFQFHSKVTRKRPAAEATPPATPAPAGAAVAEPLTVTQLTKQIDKVLKSGMPASVLVKGELSSYKPYPGSGHIYLTLKDRTSCIDCVMWKDDGAKLVFTPTVGMEVLATGRVAVYVERGKYQLYVTELRPLGQGALELAFRQLCEKLEREGLFAPGRKKPLPPYPRRVAVVTSSQTAALQDMLKVLRRFPWLRLMRLPRPGAGRRRRPGDRRGAARTSTVTATRSAASTSSSSAAAAGRWKTCGASTTRPSPAPSPRRASRSSRASATRWTRASPTWWPTTTPTRRPRPRKSSCSTGGSPATRWRRPVPACAAACG